MNKYIYERWINYRKKVWVLCRLENGIGTPIASFTNFDDAFEASNA